jgi:hypothetical protein
LTLLALESRRGEIEFAETRLWSQRRQRRLGQAAARDHPQPVARVLRLPLPGYRSPAVGHFQLWLGERQLESQPYEEDQMLCLMYGQEEPAERTGLLMLEPHPQAIQVKDMFARQLLASVHTLSTDETLMCLHELLCGRIFESLLEAVGELQIFDERNKALIKGGESHPHISARVTREEKA